MLAFLSIRIPLFVLMGEIIVRAGIAERATSMILFILLAASFLNFALASAGLSQQLTQLLTQLDLSPMALLLCVLALLVVLGFFIETLSMMMITLPIIAPLLFAAGFDKVWFGVVMILFVEARAFWARPAGGAADRAHQHERVRILGTRPQSRHQRSDLRRARRPILSINPSGGMAGR